MEKKIKSENATVEAFLVLCSYCGLRFVIEKDIIFEDGKAECPNCRVVFNLLLG